MHPTSLQINVELSRLLLTPGFLIKEEWVLLTAWLDQFRQRNPLRVVDVMDWGQLDACKKDRLIGSIANLLQLELIRLYKQKKASASAFEEAAEYRDLERRCIDQLVKTYSFEPIPFLIQAGDIWVLRLTGFVLIDRTIRKNLRLLN